MENLLDNKHVLNETLSGPNPFFADGEIPDSVAQESGLKHRLVFDPRLSEGLGFTKEDLAANRAGEMSETQRQSLRRVGAGGIGTAIAGLILFAIGAVMELDAIDPGWICCLFPIMLPLLLVIKMGEGEKAVNTDADTGKVVSITGAVFPHPETSAGIVVNDKTLRLPKVTGPIFVAGDRYVIYYVPKSNVIVAAERIDYD